MTKNEMAILIVCAKFNTVPKALDDENGEQKGFYNQLMNQKKSDLIETFEAASRTINNRSTFNLADWTE